MKKDSRLPRNIREELDVDDSDSIDSTDTPPNIKVWEVMKLAFLRWKDFPPHHIESWNQRAEWLNSRPLPGRFVNVPGVLRQEDTLEVNVCKLLTCDWYRMVKVFRNSVMRKPRRLQSSQTVYFGKEEVKVLSQTYRCMYVQIMLRWALFGINNSRLTKDELIYKSKRVLILHFASLSHLKEIFSLAGLCGMEFLNVSTNHLHFCCGKVNVKRNGRNILGYVLEESARLWTVQLRNNEIVKLRKTRYTNGKYIYGELGITCYWPVRFLLRSSGDCKFTLNRVAVDKSTGKIISEHTS